MDPLAQIPGLAGYLGMQQNRRQNALGDLQAVSGLAQLMRQDQAAQQEAALAPLRMQALQAQVAQAQGQVQDAQRKREFFTPGNMQQFMTPGEQGYEAPSAELGGGPGKPAVAPKLDFERLISAGVASGAMNPEVMINRQQMIEQRAADREARRQQLEMQFAQTNANLAQRQAFEERMRRERAEDQQALVRLTASLRPAPQPRADPLVQVEMDDPANPGKKVTRYVPQSQAAGMSPPSTVPGASRLTEGEAKGTLFYRQMKSANDQIKDLIGTGYDEANLPNQLSMRMTRSDLTNWAAPEKAQQYAQATEQWAEAYLRLKTGAATNRDEVVRNARTYFPQPGDSPVVIAQKERMRKQAEGDVAIVAGRGVQTVPDNPVTPSTTPPAPPGIDPKLWGVMTPEERKLWQK